MKTYLILPGITLFLLSLFWTGCSKNEQVDSSATPEPVNNSSENIDGHAERMALIVLSSDQQRQVFNQKSNEIKEAMWEDKINTVLLTVPLNSTQLNLLLSLKSQLSPDLWLENSAIEEAFQNNFHDNWVTQAKSAFDYMQLASIVNTLEDVTAGPFADPNSECDCSLRSDWCPVNFECKRTNCTVNAHGCGTFWVYSCRGNCEF
ncbi:MAG: bacteriocin fulvocin C-related protein [Bacteroidia bacterium]|jgi:hypothetical protein|nr:bacteriocin fulvocin C-related protein [Bacteroidia bacterium]